MVHHLKTWPDIFVVVWSGNKKFEIRKNDRGFQVGDVLVLQEYDPETKCYSGHEITCDVEWLLEGGQFGLEEGYVCMSLDNMRLWPQCWFSGEPMSDCIGCQYDCERCIHIRAVEAAIKAEGGDGE